MSRKLFREKIDDGAGRVIALVSAAGGDDLRGLAGGSSGGVPGADHLISGASLPPWTRWAPPGELYSPTVTVNTICTPGCLS